MSYEEIQKYLSVLKEISTDYRYDLGVPALSHTLGGGYEDNLLSFNTNDGYSCAYDCLEMTRDVKDDNVRYIADYELQYNDSTLFVGSEHSHPYISIPKYFSKTFLEKNFNHRLVATIASSAIRPLLYLEDTVRNGFLDKNNYLYGCKTI